MPGFMFILAVYHRPVLFGLTSYCKDEENELESNSNIYLILIIVLDINIDTE